MGIQNPSKLLYSSIPLKWEHVAHLAHELAKIKPSNSHTSIASLEQSIVSTDQFPVIDIDASLVGFKGCGKGSGPLYHVMKCVGAGISSGFEVNVVVDGNSRHSAKRASSTRAFMREYKRIKAIDIERKLSVSIQEGRSDLEVLKLSDALKSCRNTSSNVLPSDFPYMLEDHIGNNPHGKLHFFKSDQFQADPIIAQRSVNGTSDLIWSSDSDFAAHNPRALLIKDWKLSSSSSDPTNIILWTGDQKKAQQVSDILQSRFPVLVTGSNRNEQYIGIFKKPNCPIFENEDDFFCRGLMAVAIGNDFWEGGQNNFGPTSAMKIKEKASLICDINQRRQFILHEIAQFKSGKIKCEKTISAFTKAFLYEPAKVTGQAEWKYIHEHPINLPYYLREYIPDNNDNCIIGNQDEEPQVKICAHLCTGGKGHEYLEKEYFQLTDHQCEKCGVEICKQCGVHNETNDRRVCIGCYTLIVGTSSPKILSLEEMKQNLTHLCVTIPSSSSFLDIYEMHEHYVIDKKVNICTEDISQVRYPLLPVTSFGSTTLQYKFKSTVRNIGTALRGTQLQDSDVLNLVHILSRLVQYQLKPSSHCSKKIYDIHHVMPEIMIKFAEGSRVQQGLRLLKRAARHATYVHEPDVRDAVIDVGYYNGDLFLQISKNVAASFHDTEDKKRYSSTTCFTANDLICCKCKCQVGAKEDGKCSVAGQVGIGSTNLKLDDRHTCVHTLVGIYCLTMELHKGMAEHLLVELNIRNTQCGGLKETKQLHDDVFILSAAAGKKHPINASLSQMLKSFSVGTDCWKNSPGEPLSESVRPLRDCAFVSPVKKATQAIKHEQILPEHKRSTYNNSVENNNNERNQCTSDDELEMVYIKSSLAIEALNTISLKKPLHNMKSKVKRNPIGYRLLKSRALHAMDKSPNIDITEIRVNIEENLKSALCDEQLMYRFHPSNHVVFQMKRNLTAGTHTQDMRTFNKKQKLDDEENTHHETTHCSIAKPNARVHRRCKMRGCVASGSSNPLRCVPRIPKIPDIGASIKTQKAYFRKRTTRAEFTDRLGLGRCCKQSDIRFCVDHPTESIKLVVPMTIKDKHGKTIEKSTETITVKNIPIPQGVKGFQASPSSLSKGLGRDRYIIQEMKKIQKGNDSMAHVQTLEMMDIADGKQTINDINPTVAKCAGIDVHFKNSQHTQNSNLNDSESRIDRTTRDMLSKDTIHERAKFDLSNLTADDVHDLTGFLDIISMLSYAIVVCQGDIEKLTKKTSKLTWVEEWVLFFQFEYGRTHIRLRDYKRQWGVRIKTIRSIILKKLEMAVETRNKWPNYASLDEDEKFRKDFWNKMLGGSRRARIVMHDMTDLPLEKPSDSELNRATFSKYYGGNCGKGGIFTQPCGWEGTLELFTGRIGDSDYVRKSGFLKNQQSFAEKDTEVNGSIIPFINVFDKGYRVILDCKEHGGQLCWQPCFKRSDERYGSYATLHTAVVAYTRSGNERSVKHLKHSWLIVRGLVGQHFSMAVISDVWLSWGFQMNFMYDSVH